MFDPHDDTDVPSGSTDGAQMESTSSPVHRLHQPTSCFAFPFPVFAHCQVEAPGEADAGLSTSKAAPRRLP